MPRRRKLNPQKGLYRTVAGKRVRIHYTSVMFYEADLKRLDRQRARLNLSRSAFVRQQGRALERAKRVLERASRAIAEADPKTGLPIERCQSIVRLLERELADLMLEGSV